MLFLQKKVIENPKLTKEGLAVYIALRRIMNDEEKIYYISINMLAYILFGNGDYTTRFTKSIKSGFENLIDDVGIAKIEKSINQTENIVDLSGLYFATDNVKETKDYFTRVYDNEIKSIMNCKKDKFKVLKYFVFLMGTLSNSTFTYIDSRGDSIKSFIGGLTIDYLSELSGVNKSSIIKYNKLLEDKELIYVYRHDDFVLENGEIKTLHNGYGRYADKEYIIKYSREYADSKKSYNCNKSANRRKGNEKKSMLMKYNAIADGRGEYKPDEVKQIYDFILSYNKEIDTDITSVLKSNNNSEDYINMQVKTLTAKKKEISAFDDYDFIRGEEHTDTVVINPITPQSEGYAKDDVDTNKVDMNPFHTDIVDMEEDKLIKEMGWDKSDFNPDDELPWELSSKGVTKEDEEDFDELISSF